VTINLFFQIVIFNFLWLQVILFHTNKGRF